MLMMQLHFTIDSTSFMNEILEANLPIHPPLKSTHQFNLIAHFTPALNSTVNKNTGKIKWLMQLLIRGWHFPVVT